MPTARVLPENLPIEADRAETLLRAALRAGIPHVHACGGQGRCSTCRVGVIEGIEFCDPRNPTECSMATRLRLDRTVRLACQTTFRDRLVVRRLVLDDDDTALTSIASAGVRTIGRERSPAILFADLRGFTAFAESLPPYDVIHVLNRWLRAMSLAATSHGGSVNTIMGDGLMALFDQPEPPVTPETPETPDNPGGPNDERSSPSSVVPAAPGDAAIPSDPPALRAVHAGLDMIRAMHPLNDYLGQVYGRGLRMGVGIHQGPVVLGAVGLPGQTGSPHVTAIGDAVNFASRIEQATKPTGRPMLISDDTWQSVRGRVTAEAVCSVEVPGKTGRHTLYAVTDSPGSAAVI